MLHRNLFENYNYQNEVVASLLVLLASLTLSMFLLYFLKLVLLFLHYDLFLMICLFLL